MKMIRPLLLLLSLCSAYGASIPADRLPPLGYWNPGCIGTNGATYRQNGCFVPPVTLTKVFDVKANYGGIGDGVQNDTASIEAAVAAAEAAGGGIIFLTNGTWVMEDRLELANPSYPYVWHSKILRGNGPTNTFIKFYTSNGDLVDASGSGAALDRPVYLSAPAPRGSTTITLSSWDGAGYFDSKNWGIIFVNNSVSGVPWSYAQPYEGNSKSQIVHIISRNSAAHTITFDTPLYFDADTNTQFTIFYGSDSSAGVENLSVENAVGSTSQNINFSGVFNSWVRNCESKNAYKWHIRFQECARCTVEGCYIHGYYPSGGVGGGDMVYGVGFYQWTSDNLAINNHFDRCRHSMICEYGDEGNVFAYNYSSNPINEGQEGTDYLMGDMIQHGLTGFNLWEGNIASDFRMDDVLGGSIGNMCFRNNMTRSGLPPIAEGRWGYDIQTSNYWVSVVGSVLNGTGTNPTWRLGAPDGNGDYPDPPGAPNGAGTFASPVGTPADPGPTLYVHGVVDLQSNVVMWASSNTDHTLPNSLWLTAKPAFMDTNYVWPGIGPDISGYTNIIPAFVNYFGNYTNVTILANNPSTVNYSLTVSNGTGSSSYPMGNSISIAAIPPAGSIFSYWSGNIATMANTNTASTSLTMPATNITVIANYVPATLTSGLVGWYKFDDGSGSVTTDSSGSGTVGTLTNNPVWTNGISSSGALSFNGINQYVSLPKNSGATLAGLAAATVSAWVKTTTGGTVICSGGACINFGNYALSIGGGGVATAMFVNANTPGGQFILSSTNAVNDGQWHLITSVLSGTSITLYVDGINVNSMNNFSGAIYNDGGISPIDLAATPSTGSCGSPAANYFSGSIDDVRIYNRALAAGEIQSIFIGASTTSSPFPSPPGKLFVLPH